MSDLDRMWEALTQYQPLADQDGHGASWKRMCKKRTEAACWKAADAAEATDTWTSGAEAAAWAASKAVQWSARAIRHIETELKERNHE